MKNLHFVGEFLYSRPWAITEPMLREIYRIYDAHVEGKEIDFAAIEAQIGKPLQRDAIDDDLGYYVESGVAVVPSTV